MGYRKWTPVQKKEDMNLMGMSKFVVMHKSGSTYVVVHQTGNLEAAQKWCREQLQFRVDTYCILELICEARSTTLVNFDNA